MSIERSVVVQASREHAFRVFTERIGTWWSPGMSIGSAPLQTVAIEGREGGRWYERGADGSECQWGRVLAWEPPARLVLAWQIDASWRYDPAFETRVEVRFVAEAPDRTRVELEHRDLERYGADEERYRAQIGSPGGWAALLSGFAKEAEAARVA